ncbi:hypothetical protein [Sciscionella marina]|nr:hypothetical protein [Sciscionella marina]
MSRSPDHRVLPHRTSAHYKDYRAQLPELLATPIDVTVLPPVDVRS